MTETVKGGVPRWLRSTGAVLAGFAVVVILSTACDAVMHATGVFPPPDQAMNDTGLLLLALAYRGVFTVVGGWVTAHLAPSAPGKHVLVLAVIGLVAGSLGVVAATVSHLGPIWYALGVAITGPLLTPVGGRLHRGGKA